MIALTAAVTSAKRTAIGVAPLRKSHTAAPEPHATKPARAQTEGTAASRAAPSSGSVRPCPAKSVATPAVSAKLVARTRSRGARRDVEGLGLMHPSRARCPELRSFRRMDSNHHSWIQSPLSCHWTTPEGAREIAAAAGRVEIGALPFS